MTIWNETRSAVVASDAILANTPWRRLVGWMGRRHLRPGEGLVLRPCRAVHTLFVFVPLDVCYVDRTNTIVRVDVMPPWRLGPIVWCSHVVIELPAGTIARTGTRVGDILRTS
jgi:uncharacterized membrane protein (UPF0127 family)